jgi:hypothetical protein
MLNESCLRGFFLAGEGGCGGVEGIRRFLYICGKVRRRWTTMLEEMPPQCL